MRYLFSILLTSLFLSGCVTTRYNISFQDPGFNLALLKKAPVVIVATPAYISLFNFQKTFAKVYQTNENFMARLMADLTGRLKSRGLDVAADKNAEVYDKIQDSAYKYSSANNAKYLICIRSVRIDELVTNTMSPGPNGTFYGGSESSCKVDFEIVMIDLETRKIIMKFEVGDNATVTLFDYANTLETAVGKATGVLARKLVGE